MEEAEKLRLKEFESVYLPIIDNWLRWGRLRDWLPPSWRNIIGLRYRPRNREEEHEEGKEPIDEQQAVKMERIVTNLPAQFRQAFVLHYVGRAPVRGKMKIARTRAAGAKVIGVQLRQYYNRVNKAAIIISRQW